MRLLPAYLAVATADTWLAGRPEPWARRARHATKPALVPLAARRLAARTEGPLVPHVRVALVAGWAGDVALLGRGPRAFLVGLGCFATGHAALLAGLLRHRSHAPATAPLPIAALSLGAVVGPALARAARSREPGLGTPVLAYAALLTATAATGSHLDPALPAGARARLAAGTWAFLVSDGVLGARRFLLDGPAPVAERTVMATYAAAQWLIASGAASA